MDPHATIRAASSYATAESTRLNDAPYRPPTEPDLRPFPNATQDGETVLLTIEDDHGPRRFDIPMFLFLMLGVAVGGIVRLNSREPGKPDGKGRFYVRLDVGGLNMQANRIVANAQSGEMVRENPADFRSHLPEGLRKVGAPFEHGPGKHYTTRLDAVEAILRQYDKVPESIRHEISRETLEALLSRLLAIADARADERRLRDTVAAAPWDYPDLFEADT